MVTSPHQFSSCHRVCIEYFLVRFIVDGKPLSDDIDVRVYSTSSSRSVQVCHQNSVKLAVWRGDSLHFRRLRKCPPSARLVLARANQNANSSAYSQSHSFCTSGLDTK